MTNNLNEVQTIPLIAAESERERLVRIIRALVAGWALSVLVGAVSIFFLIH